jgi:hypothetical protein
MTIVHRTHFVGQFRRLHIALTTDYLEKEIFLSLGRGRSFCSDCEDGTLHQEGSDSRREFEKLELKIV